MKTKKRVTTGRLIALLLPILLAAMMLAGTVQAALLDVGPVVPEVIGSTEPNLGHGFPLWYRDTNRVPLQLCTDRASGMCLTAEPFPAQTQSFPDNMGDELFWWVGDASIDIPQQGALTRPGQAILVQAIEAAFSTGGVVSGAQVSFARIRIRIDTPYAGDYTVTTPFKQFVFNVPADAIDGGINFTEDIGIAEGGVFTGALAGSVGPFLYCASGPTVVNGKTFVGDPNVPCAVLGSTFPTPQNPTNFFRVQGPNAFDIQTSQFSVSGMLYTDPIPTPLAVDKVAYSRSATGVVVNGFATTQALSNQVNQALPFPANFALTSAPSVLELTGTGLPTVAMESNNPGDGKFFGSTPRLIDPALPTTVTVTNTADTPPTAKTVPLVDDVAIRSAMYNAATKTLVVSAASYDAVANPALSLFIPGMDVPLGALVNGTLTVTFPVTDNTVNPVKTYEIPPAQVSVVSALGGSDTRAVTGIAPITALPTGTMVMNGGAAFAKSSVITLTLSATSPNGPVTQMQFSRDGGVNYFPAEPFVGTRSVTMTAGDGVKTLFVKFIDASGGVSLPVSASITVDTVPPSGTVTINGGALLTASSLVQLALAASDDNSLVSMQLSHDGVNYFTPVAYAASANLRLFPGDGERSVSVKFIDAAGNVSAPVADSIIVNTVPPTGDSLVINGGAALTRSMAAVLTLSASASGGATVTHMQFSKDGGSYFAFEPYATTRNVSLTAGDGVKTICARFRDDLGRVSAPLCDTIIMDNTGPVGTISFAEGASTTAVVGTLVLSATDDNGVTNMQFSRNGGASYFPLEPYATTRTVSLSLGDNTLTVRYRDAAGNLSAPVSATITRN